MLLLDDAVEILHWPQFTIRWRCLFILRGSKCFRIRNLSQITVRKLITTVPADAEEDGGLMVTPPEWELALDQEYDPRRAMNELKCGL